MGGSMKYEAGQSVVYHALSRKVLREIPAVIIRVEDEDDPSWIIILKEGYPNPIRVKKSSLSPLKSVTP